MIAWQKSILVLMGTTILHVQALAQPLFADYKAVYKVLAATNQQQIGQYQVTLNWNSIQQKYLLQANIDLNYGFLWRRHRYHYEDHVWFDAQNDASFKSKASTDGQWVYTNGQRDTPQGVFWVQKQTQAKPQQDDKQQWVIGRDYDFTTFSLRFPQACTSQSIGKKVDVRILDPIAQRVDKVSSVYTRFDSAQLPIPNLEKTTEPMCMITTKSERKEMNKRSWVSAQGYLIYEESSLYRLVFDASRSNLPSQRLKGIL